MAGGYGTDHRARLVGLGNDPDLVLQAPAPPPLPPGDDLHHAIHPHTSTAALRSSLRRQEAQTQTALGGGIRSWRRSVTSICKVVFAAHGRMGWQKASGYNYRALVEADISQSERVRTPQSGFRRSCRSAKIG